MINKNICNNCGKQGHQFHQCKLPITSYGLILFRKTDTGIKYVMIRRKDSFGYIDYMRGKYMTNNEDHIKTLVDEMTQDERSKLLSQSFLDLWIELWGLHPNYVLLKNDELSAQRKFENMKEQQVIHKLINISDAHWKETEWEFPKGRRNYLERDIDCALREFEEETGISKSNVRLVENVMPFEEIFIGSNYKSYKHKYYLAYLLDTSSDSTDNYQRTEVSKIEWKTFDECLADIRPYNKEKLRLINNVNELLLNWAIL